MSESSHEKTSRMVANHLKDHHFTHQASIFFQEDDVDRLVQLLARVKRLIGEENPTSYIFYFVTTCRHKTTSEPQLYISFYSWENLFGIKLRKEQLDETIRVAGESSNWPNRQRISRPYGKRMQGAINKIRKGLTHDVSPFFGQTKVNRFGFINSKNKLSATELQGRRESHARQHGNTLT